MGATMEYLTASESQSGSRREIVADRRDNVGNLFVLKLGENRNRQILPRLPFSFREIVGGEGSGLSLPGVDGGVVDNTSLRQSLGYSRTSLVNPDQDFRSRIDDKR